MKSSKDLRNGALLQMAEAATLGLPFEVWKTRMGRFRNESTVTAFRNVYRTAGGGSAGVGAFWRGFAPKMVESATKGAVLMVAKEGIKDASVVAGMSPFAAALLGGAGGGVCQVVVMGPCTYLVCHTTLFFPTFGALPCQLYPSGFEHAFANNEGSFLVVRAGNSGCDRGEINKCVRLGTGNVY